MSRENRVILAVAVLAAAVGGWLQHQSRLAHTDGGVATTRVDAPAPALALPDLAGRVHTLADFRGRRVLLNFWATWCGPCLKEMPALDAAQRKFGDQGAIVVGIAMDDPVRVKPFLAAHAVNYPILLGSLDDPSTTRQWGDRDDVLPYSVLIDADQRIIATRRGPLDAAQLADWLQPPPR